MLSSHDANPGYVAAIVLAAGMSQRMGRLKPLLPFDGKPMLARVVDNLIAASPSTPIAPIIVVIGHNAPEIRNALCGYPVEFAHNPDYEIGGMFSSVQTGVRVLPQEAGAFLLMLGDQPTVQPATLHALLATWHETKAPVVRPAYRSKRGHPVLISTDCAGEILSLPATATLRAVVAQHAADAVEVEVEDAAILEDVDTPEDYERALQTWRMHAARL